jgi:hypothetical protein
MAEPTRQQAANQIKSAVDSGLWAGLTADEIRAIVAAHLIEKGH